METISRVPWWSQEEGLFLMCEVPPYCVVASMVGVSDLERDHTLNKVAPVVKLPSW